MPRSLICEQRSGEHHTCGGRKGLRQLPQWKLEFTQINAPLFPHLVDQLEFLADAVEDVLEGAYKELPYSALGAGGLRAGLCPQEGRHHSGQRA